MSILEIRKNGKGALDHGCIWRWTPFMSAVAVILLYALLPSALQHTTKQGLTGKFRAQGSLHLSQENTTSTPDLSTPWQYKASCNHLTEHVTMMEGLLDPRAMLKQVVQQQGRAWLQIGSNTMDSLNSNDPTIQLLDSIPTWHKVFVEPIPQLYVKLRESVRRWPNATAVNLALSPNRTIAEMKAKMWCYGDAFDSQRLGKTLPGWANQICSFNASHIHKHFAGVKVVPVDVTAVSLEELLRRSSLITSQLQVLMIDTEGFDYSVLQQIPFEQIRPAFVLWEHKHLNADMQRAEALMRSHCYAVKVLDTENTVAMALI